MARRELVSKQDDIAAAAGSDGDLGPLDALGHTGMRSAQHIDIEGERLPQAFDLENRLVVRRRTEHRRIRHTLVPCSLVRIAMSAELRSVCPP